MTFKKYPLFVVILISVLLITLLIATIVGLYSLNDRYNEKQMVSAFISLGTENINDSNFISKILESTDLKSTKKVRVFLGPYEQIIGLSGFLLHDYNDYYIFIDYGLYFSLEQSEREALLAHEIGHIIYQRNLVENLQLKIYSKLKGYVYFKRLSEQIYAKYQIKADTFSAEKTSPEEMISVLNKLYFIKSHNDYNARIENLNKIKQGQAQ